MYSTESTDEVRQDVFGESRERLVKAFSGDADAYGMLKSNGGSVGVAKAKRPEQTYDYPMLKAN